MVQQHRKRLRALVCVWIVLICMIQTAFPAEAAWNTVPTKKYPTLEEVTIVSGTSGNLEMHLLFSNNVGCIDEGQESRYDMTGYNEDNLTKFHLHLAAEPEGEEIPIRVTPHPDAAKHTDESKYFYIFADELDPDTDYVLTVDEDLYANMGNSLGASYEIQFRVNGEPQVVNWCPTTELPTSGAVVLPLYLVSTSVENNGIIYDDLQPTITMTFAYNVSGPEMMIYNQGCIFLFQGNQQIPITVDAGVEVSDLVLTPVEPLMLDTEYKIVVIKELTARNGSTMSSPVNLYFTTAVTPPTRPDPEPQDQGGGGNGSVSPETPTTPVEPEERCDYFSDTIENWARNDINTLADLGAVTGRPDGTFGPDDSITRAEMVAILVRALGLESESGNSFSDTRGHWAAGYISTATACGIVNGMGNGSFEPNGTVTREQLMVMLVGAGELTMPKEYTAPRVPDQSQISSWAVGAVEIAVAHGVVSGYEDGTIRPTEPVTRAEACRMIINLLTKMKQMEK